MSESFSVGEIAVGFGFVVDIENNGMECEIEGPLEWAAWYHPNGEVGECFGHDVRWADGEEGFERPEHLRKRRPPQDWKKLCRLTDAPRTLETA